MDFLLQDIRYATRMLLKKPGVTFVAVLALALGIGATTTIFSLVNAVLLRPLPVKEPDRLFDFNKIASDGTGSHAFSYPEAMDYRQQSSAFEGVVAWTMGAISLSTGKQAEVVMGGLASEGFFQTLGIKPALGRFFLPEEEREIGKYPVVVIGHDLWQNRFGGDSSVIGSTVTLSNSPFTIVGVAPKGFNGLMTGLTTPLWVPIVMQPQAQPGQMDILQGRNVSGLQVFARLKQGATLEQGESEIDRVTRQIAAEHPQSGESRVDLAPLTGLPGGVRSDIAAFMAVLMAVAGMVLLIACINVASMLLARSVARRREIAIRMAIGAGRVRLIRQLLTETLLLFTLGGSVGVLLAFWAVDALLAFKPPIEPAIELDLALDMRVLGFTLGISLLTGLLFGLVPALQTSRVELVSTLKDDVLGASVKKGRLRNAFVTAQVGLSLLLLIGAGLFLRTLQHASEIDPGFDPTNVHVASFELSLHGYGEKRGKEFYSRLEERIAGIPGVQSVTISNNVPLSMNAMGVSCFIEGKSYPGDGDGDHVDINTVGLKYFETLRIPLARGRDFIAEDLRVNPDSESSDPTAVIINEAMARKYWPGEEALGKRISISGPGGPFAEIVGVARDGKYRSLGEDPLAYMYIPIRWGYDSKKTLSVRTNAATAGIGNSIRQAVAEFDPNIPVLDLMPMEQFIGVSLLPQRMAATIASAFGILGLILASVGIYGMVAYRMAQRTREIGIRMALGAGRRHVLLMVLRQGLLPVLVGLGIGIAGALVSTRLLSGLIFGISATDPITFISVSMILAGVAFIACYIPARRATRIDPMRALRYE